MKNNVTVDNKIENNHVHKRLFFGLFGYLQVTTLCDTYFQVGQ